MPLASQVLGIGGRKSIQRGVVFVTVGTAVSVPIAPVDPAWTELRLLGSLGSAYWGDGSPISAGYISLASGGGSVTVNAFGNPTYPAKVSWELTEFYPS
jgi:hypothetical protein